MLNNYLTTIPQVADKLRTLGHSKPEPFLYLKNQMETLNPANKDFRDNWRAEANKSIYDRINNIKLSQADLLLEKYYPKKSNNRSQAPFQTSKDESMNYQKGYSGGSNITSSSSLSDIDYENYRHELLNNRLAEYSQQSSTTPSALTPQAPSQMNNYKQFNNSNNLLLRTIEERVGSGIIDSGVFNDLLKVIQFYTSFIWQIDNVPEFVEIINRLKEIVANAEAIRINKNSRKLDPREERDVQYVDSFLSGLDRLLVYVNENAQFVGRSENERRLKAQSKMANIPLPQVQFKVQKATAEEAALAPPPPALAPTETFDEYEEDEAAAEAAAPPAYAPRPKRYPSEMNLDEIRTYAIANGFRPFEVDSKATILSVLRGESLTAREERKREKNPAKYAGTGKIHYSRLSEKERMLHWS
jgi:hypothetical protein